MVLECPQCGLINPPNSQRCDCGYNFVSQPTQMFGEHANVEKGPSVFPIKVSAFWFVVLQATSSLIYWSGAADSSWLLSGVAFVCMLLALGALVELTKGWRRRRVGK